MTVGARLGPVLLSREVHKCRTVGRSHSGSAEFCLLVVLSRCNREGVPVLLGERKAASDVSLVGVPFDGNGREAGEPTPLGLDVPRPLALVRAGVEESGRTLSRIV